MAFTALTHSERVCVRRLSDWQVWRSRRPRISFFRTRKKPLVDIYTDLSNCQKIEWMKVRQDIDQYVGIEISDGRFAGDGERD